LSFIVKTKPLFINFYSSTRGLQNEDVEPPTKKSAVEEEAEHESQVKATDAFV